MTGRQLSATAIRSMNAEATDEVWLALIAIEHADLPTTIRLVNNTENITSNGVEFIALPFDLDLPSEGERAGEARLRIDNVNRVITEWIRTIQTPPKVTIQIILASDPDEIELEIAELTMRDVTYDAGSVMGYLRYENLVIEPVADTITPSRFPALF